MLASEFADDFVLSTLDASGLYTLLLNLKQDVEGIQTTWFGLEQ